MLDDDTLMLEYARSHERSVLWAITSNTFASFELPGREKIEQAARQTYRLLTVSHRRQHKREAERAAELSRMLLGPVADRLGKKRLLSVADDILQYVPFVALPVPEAQAYGAAPYTPLIVAHEVINLPSASVLAGLRREVAGRKRADKLIAVLADPVVQPDDERIKQAASGRSSDKLPVAERATANDLPEAASEVGLSGLERLPFTGQEAAAILSLAGEKNSL